MTRLLIKLFVKNGNDTKDAAVRRSYGTFASIVGIVFNILLCLVKIIIGTISSSLSIVADGLNNLSDMGSSVITMIGFKMAGKPADRDHPFGHGRFEYISAIIVAFLIILVGFELLTSSVKSLISGESAPVYSTWALIALAVSVAVKLWLFFFNRKLGKLIDSSALIATAQDSANDCIATSAILLAAVFTGFVELPFNLDAVMALGVSLFILASGITAARETIDHILGGPPPKELVEELEREIMAFDVFEGIHDLIVHNYGPGRQFASVHVEVPQDIDIVSCHEQIDLCEKLVMEKTDVCLVIHMDPIDVNNEQVTLVKQRLAEAIRTIDERLTLHDFRMTPAAKHRTNLIFDVVLPANFKYSPDEMNEKIGAIAKEIDPTYCCVITYDNDFTGH